MAVNHQGLVEPERCQKCVLARRSLAAAGITRYHRSNRKSEARHRKFCAEVSRNFDKCQSAVCVCKRVDSGKKLAHGQLPRRRSQAFS